MKSPHNICRNCWDRLHPGQEPILAHPDPTEICCFCQGSAGDGIYTRDEIEIIKCDCNTDLDRWSAEGVMEWVLGKEIGKTHTDAYRYYRKVDHKPMMMESDWRPSDLKTGQIWMVVEKMRERGWMFKLVQWKDCYTAWFERPGRHEWQMGDTPATAILKAAKATEEKP